jgi:hypothetical protein
MKVLDSVEKVLAEAGQPLHCREITKRLLAGGLWKPTGRTPQATVSSQLAVDVKKQGAASRFKRVGAGTFGLNEAVAPAGSEGAPGPSPQVPVSFSKAAEQVLDRFAGRKPMHYRDITRKALELGLISTAGRTPEATIDNLLDNITPTNRDLVDRRIEKLRDEMVALERKEAALGQQQDRERQAKVLADQAFALVRSFSRLVEAGTVDEKRTVVRAFLRGIDYDPESRSGKGHFWLLPGVGLDDQEPNPGGRGRRTDVTGNISPRAGVEAADSQCSLLGFRAGYTRSEEKRSATGGGASSFDMVAGAGFASEKKTRLSWRTREIGFRLDYRRYSRHRGRLAPRAVTPTTVAARAKVAGSERGKAVRAA